LNCPLLSFHNCYDFSAALRWLTSPLTRKLLGVSATKKFEDNEAELAVVSFLDGIRVMYTQWRRTEKREHCFNFLFSLVIGLITEYLISRAI
jgi:hypothetical protein